MTSHSYRADFTGGPCSFTKRYRANGRVIDETCNLSFEDHAMTDRGGEVMEWALTGRSQAMVEEETHRALLRGTRS